MQFVVPDWAALSLYEEILLVPPERLNFLEDLHGEQQTPCFLLHPGKGFWFTVNLHPSLLL